MPACCRPLRERRRPSPGAPASFVSRVGPTRTERERPRTGKEFPLQSRPHADGEGKDRKIIYDASVGPTRAGRERFPNELGKLLTSRARRHEGQKVKERIPQPSQKIESSQSRDEAAAIVGVGFEVKGCQFFGN